MAKEINRNKFVESDKLRDGEYAEKGDYHITLNPNWPYLPVYLSKMAYAKKFLAKKGTGKTIIDLGAGEGVLVRTCREELGLDMIGLDLNYQSDVVVQGDILELDYPDESFDIVTCMDVIEHMHFYQQEIALAQMFRILKPGGVLLLSVPNLAHLASRFTFMFLGRLLRTSTIDRHMGDRPSAEYVKLLRKDFTIERSHGMFPTLPLISALTYFNPAKVVGLHRFYNAIFGFLPGWCFLNIFEARKPLNK